MIGQFVLGRDRLGAPTGSGPVSAALDGALTFSTTFAGRLTADLALRGALAMGGLACDLTLTVDFWQPELLALVMRTGIAAIVDLSPYGTLFRFLACEQTPFVPPDHMVLGIPGETTDDGVFLEDLQPQVRLNSSQPVERSYEVMYHGVPGIASGDDNWEPAMPVSWRPQLRLNTLPHTEPAGVGRWKVNEVFLAR